MGRKLNIGLVIDDIDNFFSNQAAIGAEQAAKTIDANLFVFPGHYIGKTDSRYADRKYEYQYNMIFDLPTERNVDIIYILQGLICSRADIETQKAFLQKMPKVPIVCLFSDFEGYHSVTFNNASGLKETLDHLIERHGAKDIGFVSGPVTNRDARERLDIYKQVLENHGIPVDENKIVYGDFSMSSEAVTGDLLDKNNKLDAVVFANDSMAVGGYNELNARGLVPGKDIMVAGFDDDIFSVSLEPPLTTVEASSASLAYKAVLNAENYIKGTALKDMTVDTHLVQRSSCGCEDFDAEVMYKRFHIEGNDIDVNKVYKIIKEYLFNDFVDAGAITEALDGFVSSFIAFLKAEDKASMTGDMNDKFALLLKSDLFVLSTREKFFNVLQTMQNKSLSLIGSDNDRDLINDVFTKFYRRIAFSGILPANSARRRNERMRSVVNRQMGEVFLNEGGSEIPYESLLGGLYGLGFEKSMLYLFQGNVKNKGDADNWRVPASILLKAYSEGKEIKTPSEELQLLRTEYVFENEFVDESKRRTMIVAPLFVGENVYGLIVIELPLQYSISVSSIASQISVTLRSLYMMEEQNKAKQALQNSLERFIRDNTKLEEIAQKDELTDLYNRRGFITNSEKKLDDPVNQDKVAVICYADMDNLKKINDKYGHDDGDFALCTIAEILRESFRDSDVIGRFGGDEFVTLAITGADIDVDKLKARIDTVTKRLNEQAGKPYPIEMSTGIFKFTITGKIDIYEILNNADELLYQEKIAKKTGRGVIR